MDHNGFERHTQHFPSTIKINWTNPAWCLRDVIVQILPLSWDRSRVLKIETKISACNELLKWTGEFYNLLRIVSFKMFYLIHEKQRL